MQVQVTILKPDGEFKTLIAFESGISSLADVTGRTLCKDSSGKLIGVVPHTPSVVSIKLV